MAPKLGKHFDFFSFSEKISIDVSETDSWVDLHYVKTYFMEKWKKINK